MTPQLFWETSNTTNSNVSIGIPLIRVSMRGPRVLVVDWLARLTGWLGWLADGNPSDRIAVVSPGLFTVVCAAHMSDTEYRESVCQSHL